MRRAQILETVAAIRTRWEATPDMGVVLGSGLGTLAGELVEEARFDYAELPHMGRTTALGHRGRLICGRLGSRAVAMFQGRFHLYEGRTPQQAALPVRVLRELGGSVAILTNAAGGLNPQFQVGDLMALDDHVNLMFANPLLGPNDDAWGPRFPDMSEPYDRRLLDEASAIARREGFPLHRGVYVGMLGPTYETRAEYRMCRRLGGDAVGMSTVPETLAARHAGMRVLALSVITNLGSPDAPRQTSGHDVMAAASAAAVRVAAILRRLGDSSPPARLPADDPWEPKP